MRIFTSLSLLSNKFIDAQYVDYIKKILLDITNSIFPKSTPASVTTIVTQNVAQHSYLVICTVLFHVICNNCETVYEKQLKKNQYSSKSTSFMLNVAFDFVLVRFLSGKLKFIAIQRLQKHSSFLSVCVCQQLICITF